MPQSFTIRSIRFIVLLIAALSMVYPILWMLTIALQNSDGLFKVPPEWYPTEFRWSNFWKGAEQIHFLSALMNTVIISVSVTVGQVLSSVLISYGLTRIKFPGRDLWFYLFICSLILPPIVSLIPVFYIFSKLNLFDTWWPLILPAFFGSPFHVFLGRQFYSSIPFSYDEAAKIDGANHLQILTKIIVPMSKPMIVTMAILSFQTAWGDYLNPTVYILDQKLWTLSLAIGGFVNATGTTWNLFMATNLLYMLPPLILFFVAQKYFMEGLGSMNNAGLK
ncbi:carbohydrate ABC transporter permease [Paenibacillus guangzhouensis]|uniref:carbohydrate ABC transporter permease n=1 Tax=Paenibacillus guangzhouensis TaxID=1473112 RepID=UPI00187B80FD|nr:carbohydrate ABC transporter permease [Paenibacillus guangzhouensis]